MGIFIVLFIVALILGAKGDEYATSEEIIFLEIENIIQKNGVENPLYEEE